MSRTCTTRYDLLLSLLSVTNCFSTVSADDICTFTFTKKDYVNQPWYHCETCNLTGNLGCCAICAAVCHKGHNIKFYKMNSFYCDCGTKEICNCEALVARHSIPAEVTCCICLTNQRNTVFQPCGHLCCCDECGNLDQCPVCREAITNKLKVYIA